MTYETIRYDVEEGIATVTLDRPDRLNAFTNGMMEELIDALNRIDADDNVRVAIFTGAGRAFCAGADLSDGPETFVPKDDLVNADGSLNYSSDAARDSGGRVALRIFRCLKPIIAAINGPAVGIGATMTLPMDIRLASGSARIGFVFARRGIVSEAASAWFLPRVVGVSQALEWCTTGRVFDANEARAAGLVRSLHAPDDLLTAARALAREIADNTAPVSVALMRQMIWRGLGMSNPMEAHRIDSRGILSRGQSRDVAEGLSAFLEKRPARFVDKVSTDMPDYFPWWDEPAYK
ncbi:enoyl-CoA hydratase [Altererythrobacter sp. FM1]|uniref:crotonase/enoyl-CoA hydratase family protein n=1 Tax=Tsuneonella flava TaxID=2055955 RepID=UPI000C80B8A9|nr:crotonase/enoyl-CoA hydratase family protein [Tsuneonella flava]ROT93933.1 enoyl-CoA hydratase [Altererythrobacter sp. FM1]